MLFLVAKFIAMGTFGQYTSIEDVLAIPPPKTAKVKVLKWDRRVLNRPIFALQNGKIRSSSSLSNQLKSLGHRAGYAEPPRFHDLRAANLHNIGESFPVRQVKEPPKLIQ